MAEGKNILLEEAMQVIRHRKEGGGTLLSTPLINRKIVVTYRLGTLPSVGIRSHCSVPQSRRGNDPKVAT
jgi:hypothetical protein